MRTSTFLTAAFAGVALSSPLVKRDVVMEIDTVYDVVYVTQYVTETAGASAAEVTSSVAEVSTPAVVEVTTTVTPAIESSVVESSADVTPTSVQQNAFYKNRHSWVWSTSVEVASSAVTVATYAPSSTSVDTVPSTSTDVASSSAAAPASTSSAAETSTVAATSTAAATSAAATGYQQRVVAHHNYHRANHSAPDIKWSDALAATAKKIADTCVYEHNTQMDGGGYGQNIAAGQAAGQIGSIISDQFYNGEVNYFNGLYGQANPSMDNFENWGHFSQIVWKSTTKVGCATVDCSASGLANTGQYVSPYFTVCNYSPPGNYGGEYADNIGKSLGRATIDSTYTG